MSKRAVRLAEKHTMEELVAMQKEVSGDPKNRVQPTADDPRPFHLYTPNARAKMQEIAWAITYHLRGDVA